MPHRQNRRRAGDAGQPVVRRRRWHGDRYTALAATSALLIAVALVAVPLAVDSLREPGKPAAQPLSSRGPGSSTAMLDAVSAILSPAVDAPLPAPDVMARSLGDLGASAIPVVVGMLCGEIPTPQVQEGSWDQPIHPGALACREQVLFASLRYFRAKDVVEYLRGHSAEAGFEARLVCARLLGLVATSGAQEALLEMLAQFSAPELEREYVRSTLEEALARCIEKDPAALRELSKRIPKLDPTLLPLLARSLGRTHGPQSAEALARLIGRSAQIDVAAMQALARVTESSGIGLSAGALVDVRRMLESDDAQVQRTALTVLGRAGDRDSFDAILTRLCAADRMVAVAARWSLRTLAGADLGTSVEPWSAWNDEQERWWNEQYDGVRAQLQADDNAQVFAAILQLSERAYFRHELVADLGPLACAESADIALPAIAALQRLGSTRAWSWLLRALEIDDARRKPAAAALRTLFGWDLPAEHAAWEQALAGFEGR